MRAWILERQAKIEDRPLRLEEIPTPEPSDREIRIKTQIEVFPFEQLADILPLVKGGKVQGNAVIKMV